MSIMELIAVSSGEWRDEGTTALAQATQNHGIVVIKRRETPIILIIPTPVLHGPRVKMALRQANDIFNLAFEQQIEDIEDLGKDPSIGSTSLRRHMAESIQKLNHDWRPHILLRHYDAVGIIMALPAGKEMAGLDAYIRIVNTRRLAAQAPA